MKARALLFSLLLVACNEAAHGGNGPIDLIGGRLIEVPVGNDRVFVDLAKAAVVKPDDSATSTGWDIAFEGLEVYTNSGPSGPGTGGGFGPLGGPLDPKEKPDVPFIQADKTGGAFLDWYAYDGAKHQLFSRYHTVGLKRGDRTFKVQLLGYYGELEGAPVSAVYRMRYAEVTEEGDRTVHELEDVDGTAGGIAAPENAPSTCLDLASGERFALTAEEARASSAWDLCFRRESVSVNGETGGPRGDTAVDLDAAKTAGESLEALEMRTAASEKARFDAVDRATLVDDGLVYRGDRIVSIFSGAWIAADGASLTPENAGWLVVGADGKTNFLVVFEAFEGASATMPGTIRMRVATVL